MALFRLFFILMIVLTVVYLSLSFFSRAKARARLEAEWDARREPGTRETYVQSGLSEYDGSLRRKLILGVYVVPLSLVCLIIYLVNFA